jgi:hypothetical protein
MLRSSARRRAAALLASASLVGLLAAGLPSAAQAAPPVHLKLGPSTYEFDNVCTFPLRYEETVNKETLTVFVNGKAIVSGSYKVTLTNLTTGATLVVKASGPQFFDGSATVTESGPQIFVLFPGDVMGPGVYLLEGRITATRDATGTTINITNTGTTSHNLCNSL